MPCNVDVLIVDDRAVDADMTLLAVRLAAPNARVLWLSDGEQAIEYLFGIGRFERRSRPAPGLLLLDAHMPAMSGPCVLDLIRAHPYTYDIPVVMLSPDDGPAVRRRHDEFAADAYIVKPVDFERYCAVVEAMLNRWLPEDLCLAAFADPWDEPSTARRGRGAAGSPLAAAPVRACAMRSSQFVDSNAISLMRSKRPAIAIPDPLLPAQ